MLISDGLRDVVRATYDDNIWSMRLPYKGKYHIFIYGYIIGNVLVFLALRPRIYLNEYQYVNDGRER